jgi:hypothetical protein
MREEGQSVKEKQAFLDGYYVTGLSLTAFAFE